MPLYCPDPVLKSLATILVIILLACCGACSKADPGGQADVAKAKDIQQAVQGCRGCHPLSLDRQHDFPCDECHRGDPQANAKDAAHAGLVEQPAHPDRMTPFCGRCHEATVRQAVSTLHFNIANEINLVRQAFGAKEDLASLTAIPQYIKPESPGQLAEDLLRRRCLRCHLYSTGDSYPATRHGTGCAACHLAFANGALIDHQFMARPTDQQCLSCHYGNRVGADYYGRFEHDVNWDYRTPFQAAKGEVAQPYGLGYHQLVPDLHQQAAMACIDCHGGQELMAGAPRLSCRDCHEGALGPDAPSSLTETDGRRLLTTVSGKRLEVPLMKDPAHDRYGGKVACQVCHGQWSFSDRGNHLLRLDDPDYEPWQALTRQGNAEIEAKLEAALSQGAGDTPATMTDGITGSDSPGVWLQAYELRRWEEINTCLDGQGILQVCRPILDLHLSYVNPEGEVIFDAVHPAAGIPVMLPYTPHTTGRAGAFFPQRLDKAAVP